MRIQLTVPGEPNAQTLGIALEAATGLAQHEIRTGDVPPIEDAIRAGVVWQEEPPGEESFDKPSTVLVRGWGDCDDLAPWLAGEMRETGYDPGASAIAIPTGYKRWHAIVQGSDGQLYDPSEWAGMGHGMGGPGVGACACCKPLNPGKVGIKIGQNLVRVDVPGLQASRGCPLGVAHIQGVDFSTYDPDTARVVALIETIEDAIATAQLARTGDKRAIKQLAVIYRVLRGEDLATACNGVGLREDRVGLDFSSSAVRTWIQRAREFLATAADELFNGETYTAHGDRIVKARKVAVSGVLYSATNNLQHHVGFVPCLAPLVELGAVAATAGTLAAVVGPIALALSKMVGEDTDFGRAMRAVMDVTDKVSLASAVSAGVEGLITDGIPAAWTDGVSRWAELLNSPLSAAGVNPNTKAEVANTLHWVERQGAITLPNDLATRLAPKVLDAVSQSQKVLEPLDASGTLIKGAKEKAAAYMKDAYDQVRNETVKWLNSLKGVPGALPPNVDIGKLADAKATAYFNELIASPPPPAVIPIPEGAYTPGDTHLQQGPTPEGPPVADPGLHAPRYIKTEPISFKGVTLPGGTLTAEVDDAEHVRQQLRTVPMVAKVPAGWDPLFALGCRQLTGQCP